MPFQIWTEHFRNKDAVCGVIPAETYEKLYETAIKYPCVSSRCGNSCLLNKRYCVSNTKNHIASSSQTTVLSRLYSQKFTSSMRTARTKEKRSIIYFQFTLTILDYGENFF